MDLEYISYQMFDRYATRIQNKNLKEYNHSLCASGIANLAHDCIVEIQPGKDENHGILVVRSDWRKIMRERAEAYRTARAMDDRREKGGEE